MVALRPGGEREAKPTLSIRRKAGFVSNRVAPTPGRMRSTTKVLLGGGMTLAVLGSMTAAQAAIPAEDGTISACYVRSSGAVRIIDASQTSCTSTESAISWNQRGPAGAAGHR